jgi:hypothetical protein
MRQADHASLNAAWKDPQVCLSIVCGSSEPQTLLLQPYEVLRAIEHKDVMFLMEIRDRAFPVC